MSDDDVLREAYARLGRTGPEFEGWLSNHGPMAVEAMVRRGRADAVDHWLDAYRARLEDAPRATDPVTPATWRDALGDPRRLGDWPVFFAGLLAEADWHDVLAAWWPRLLPGIAAGATHGVIRVGHVVQALEQGRAGEQGIEELARALGYWAARWQPVPGVDPDGTLTADDALRGVPGLPAAARDGGINDRLARLDGMVGWGEARARVRPPADTDEAPGFLRDVVTAAVVDYAERAHGSPVMLVHAATAPHAVLRSLPSLPRPLWVPSAVTAWAATTAVRAAYLPPDAAEVEPPRGAVEDLVDSAVTHGDEHLVKLTDTALEAHAWTGDRRTLAAVRRGRELIEPLRP